MPYTLQYRPVLIDTLISNARIASYQTVFSPANDMELMGAYLERARLRALYPLMGAVEITLRNAIDQTLSASMDILVGRESLAAPVLRNQRNHPL